MISNTTDFTASHGEDAQRHPETIADYLLDQARTRPETIALIYKGENLTYRNLYLRSLAIADQLKVLGVKKGDRVGLLFPNHSDYVAAFFAILFCGAVVVPINPLLKSEEIAHILTDSQAKAIVVHQSTSVEVALAKGKGLIDAEVVCFRYNLESDLKQPPSLTMVASDELANLQSEKNSAPPTSNLSDAAPDDLAVLVYTSGTTGKPKGAMLSHANLRSAVKISESFFEFTAQDRFLTVLPLCHIYGLTVVMLGLLSKGGTLVIADRFEPVEALSLIEAHKVTFLPAVPAMYQFMLLELNKRPYDLSSLRVCLSGAAPMPLALFSALKSAFQVPIVEGYGLTETSSIATVNPLHGIQKLGSVGIPLPGLQVKVVASDRSFCPPGPDHIGEVAIKGPNVMKGYYLAQEATESAFVDDWFLTGDLGYVDEESYLFLVGRTKEMIIRGGLNIYPREVEDVIGRMPAVAEVAVVGVPDEFMGERVKAVVVIKKSQTLTEDEVKTYCASCLADFKVPRLVEFMDSLPRNSTGKVLKRILQLQ